MKRLLVPLAWILIGASLAWTWTVVASESAELADDDEIMPSQVVAVESGVRGGSVSATIVVSYERFDVPAQAQGLLTSLAIDPPTRATTEGFVWATIDGRPRILAAATEPYAFHRDLQKGSKGADVEVLQRYLRTRGFEVGDLDGKFGSGLQAALLSYRESIGALTTDKVLRHGDLVFVRGDADLEFVEMAVGSYLDRTVLIAIGVLPNPVLQLRYLPRDAQTVVVGSEVVSPDFVGAVASIEREPLLTETGYILIATVEGELMREVADTESLEAEVSNGAKAQLWLPAASIAIDAQGEPFVVTPDGLRVAVSAGDEAGGRVALLSGVAEGEKYLLPNPELFNE